MPSNRQETWGRGFFWFALLSSLIGFLGYYDAQGFVTTPPAIVLGLQLVAGGVGFLLLRRQLLTNIRGVLPLIMVAVWAAITLVWADDPSTALRRWLLVFTPGILVCLLAASDPRPRQTFAWFTALVAMITIASGAFSAIVMEFADTIIPENALSYSLLEVNGWLLGIAVGGRQFEIGLYIPRYSGLTSNPNSMSLFAAIGLIALSAIARPGRSKRGLAIVLVIGLVVYLLLLSGSRASFAMTAVGIMFVVLLRMNWRRTARFCVLLICGLTAALYLVTWSNGPETELSPAETAATLSEREADFCALSICSRSEEWRLKNLSHTEVFELRERSQSWRIAMQTVGEVWPLGLGFGLTQEAVYTPLGLETSAHSLTITALVETGAVGLLLVLVAWFNPVFRTTQGDRNLTATDIAIVALLMGLFVHQIVDNSVFRYHWAHFIFVYLLGASARLSGWRTNA
jgi:hypothetical protein